MDTRELDGRSFVCLAGCGFCCTFQPEASQRELGLLRKRLAPKPLAVVVGDERSYLGLHNKCGACTLLERRECQAYDLRPAHCRYFPFHVHFGPTAEVHVNETCRGVERVPGGDLRGAFALSVEGVASKDDWVAHERDARATYAEFERKARRAGAWGDVDAVAREALTGATLSRAWMERALARAGEPETTPDDMIADALAPFSAPDVTKRPFYLAPDLRWLTFDGPTRVVEMDEKGALHAPRHIEAIAGWVDAPADLAPYVRELAQRGIFRGSVYAIVDDNGYDTTVEEATWFRLAEIAAEVTTRARVLAAMGVPREQLAAETVRFYDSAFLDAPTIGGFL